MAKRPKRPTRKEKIALNGKYGTLKVRPAAPQGDADKPATQDGSSKAGQND